MEGDLVLREVYYTHDAGDGLTFNARPGTAETVATHRFVAHKVDTGTPIRVYILDANESRKFSAREGEEGIFLSEDGEQGYIGYYDYQIETDQSITSRALYIHPLHRNRGITRKLLLFIESLAEEGVVYNDHIITNPVITEIVDDIISRGKSTVNYRTM